MSFVITGSKTTITEGGSTITVRVTEKAGSVTEAEAKANDLIKNSPDSKFNIDIIEID